MDLISCNTLETDILSVLVLLQLVCGFDFLQPLETNILTLLVLDQLVRGFDFLQPIED